MDDKTRTEVEAAAFRGLIKHLQDTRSLPLLIISGLGPEAPELACARDREIPILGKPFTPDELLGAVGDLLG